MKSEQFWVSMQELLVTGHIVIDRPSGKPHPRFPHLIYPLDYGYIENTASGDGDGIDVWIGSIEDSKLTGILCSFDTVKRDAEIKLLVGCTTAEVETILEFNRQFMRYLFIPKPEE